MKFVLILLAIAFLLLVFSVGVLFGISECKRYYGIPKGVEDTYIEVYVNDGFDIT